MVSLPGRLAENIPVTSVYLRKPSGDWMTADRIFLWALHGKWHAAVSCGDSKEKATTACRKRDKDATASRWRRFADVSRKANEALHGV